MANSISIRSNDPEDEDEDEDEEGHDSLSEAEDESTSSSGSDSTYDDNLKDLENDNDQDADENPQIRIPRINKTEAIASSHGLKYRLTTFLPLIEKANVELAADGNLPARRMDTIEDDEEHYIEMNLGLGVLKEKPVADKSKIQITSPGSDPSSDDSDEHEQSEEDMTDQGIIDKLKGDVPSTRPKRKIEEMS